MYIVFLYLCAHLIDLDSISSYFGVGPERISKTGLEQIVLGVLSHTKK